LPEAAAPPLAEGGKGERDKEEQQQDGAYLLLAAGCTYSMREKAEKQIIT